ncbi:MAG: tRNA (adenosine(37)-N6)-threonylcarbamoyltransferase complex transferase subunit TsaD [Candidatus Aminicenantes bacterium]|nr:tRNA (adenosine(37)-N6)-threonylcarbamoyltransferase complex transferase subunit TsaD [Candidatus Aminicenantes bacterium]RLE02795.1 MAG: tRNA (adenosine(37)-N6)-threonylcarbamoyltransferase complex transferase subunit TsaD [Candidatus Aminicenantes bacterium]HHF42963.1 tRNA (adenosine(37)-N6)-threonylcarbamoyltransferase complex transferase subunit TsaD [Candidatus Aminicenantes bacterium]
MKKILAIETSCDETAAAVVDEKINILSNIVLSQDEIHAPYGGIVPELASRQHIISLTYVVEEALTRAGLSLADIDAFAVTQGPGLIGSLLVGLSLAKGLAFYWQKPLIPVDHLEAHLESVFIEQPDLPLPALGLLVSGGHTSLYWLPHRLSYQLLGRTRDDAAGEALDKVAKFLDLGYPGGPIIERLAEKGDGEAFPFSVPQMRDKSLDFSFSGLKTAALKYIREENISSNHPRFHDFIASFERGVIRALLSNMKRAALRYRPRSVFLCGGVSRNKHLRQAFLKWARKKGWPAAIPSPQYCTDNAAMVGALAMFKWLTKSTVSLDLELNAYPRFIPEGDKSG